MNSQTNQPGDGDPPIMLGSDAIDTVRALVHDLYDPEVVSVCPLRVAVQRSVYRIRRANDDDWVFRVDRGQNAWRQTTDRVAILRFLAERGYPAPRVVPTRAGTPTATIGSASVLAVTYMGGNEGTYSPPQLYRLAEAVAHLHSLDLDRRALDSLPQTRWMPAVELHDAVRTLTALASVVPARLVEWHDRLLMALGELDGLCNTPRAIIHTDISPQNAVFTPDDVVLIDWDEAGTGPALYDLAWLLASADGGRVASWPDVSRVEAIMDGYTAQRPLVAGERALLFDAVRLGPAVDAAKNFAAFIQEQIPTEAWHKGWARYQAAYEVIDIVRKYLVRER